MDKLEEYNDVVTRLVSETVSCTPAEWDHGALTIDCDGRRIDYKLKNEQQPGTARISGELRALCEELYARMSRQGDTWTQAIITFNREGDDVEFETAFQYAQPASPMPSAVPASPPFLTQSTQKPWWKFGRG
jgi:hypothetical protein